MLLTFPSSVLYCSACNPGSPDQCKPSASYVVYAWCVLSAYMCVCARARVCAKTATSWGGRTRRTTGAQFFWTNRDRDRVRPVRHSASKMGFSSGGAFYTLMLTYAKADGWMGREGGCYPHIRGQFRGTGSTLSLQATRRATGQQQWCTPAYHQPPGVLRETRVYLASVPSSPDSPPKTILRHLPREAVAAGPHPRAATVLGSVASQPTHTACAL